MQLFKAHNNNAYTLKCVVQYHILIFMHEVRKHFTHQLYSYLKSFSLLPQISIFVETCNYSDL